MLSDWRSETGTVCAQRVLDTVRLFTLEFTLEFAAVL